MAFKPVVDRLPEGTQGIAYVKHFEVPAQDLRAMLEGVRPGKYARLVVNDTLMMTDTAMEHATNREIDRRAHGRILIAGLGIGMLLTALLDKPEVEHVLVVEKYQDVIDLVEPHYRHPKLTVVCADIFEWKPAKGETFEVIYFDIWPFISTENLPQMATLHRRFAHCLNRSDPNAWMGSWLQDELRAERRREKTLGF